MRDDLTRRERQILEILYSLSEATASQIREAMPDSPSDATVRTLLRILEEKQIVVHRTDGKRFVFRPKESHRGAAAVALRRVLEVFFGGSIERAIALHLADPKAELGADEVKRLRKFITSPSQGSNRHGKSVRKADRVD